MDIAWHGGPSVSLQLQQTRITIDPQFSPRSAYADWYIPNKHAPDWDGYVTEFSPDVVLLTHAHFDHFDLHTIGQFCRDTNCSFIASRDIISTISEHFNPHSARLIPITGSVTIDSVRITAYEAVHWNTGDKGRKISEKLKHKPDRYGVMPCGGPAFGYLLTTDSNRVYVSGDTMPEGIPRIDADVAIVNITAPVLNPATGKAEIVALTPADITTVYNRTGADNIICIHFDSDLFTETISKQQIHASTPAHVNTIILPYNSWYQLDKDRERR